MAKNFVEQITVKAETTGFDKIQQSLESFGKSADKLSKKFESLGSSLSLSITAPLAGLGALALREFGQAERAIAKVESALQVTGNRIGLTFDELQKASQNIQQNSIFGDDEILEKVSSQLLRIPGLTKQTFFEAQQAVTDLSAALGNDLQGATLQVAKALENPVEAINSLSRVGIRFSKDQQALIKSLVESGRAAEAQGIIIDRLNAKFEGTAKAISETSLGAIQQFRNNLGDLAEVIGGALFKVINPFLKQLNDIVLNLQTTNPKILDLAVKLGILAASIGPVLLVLSKLRLAFLFFTGPVGIIALMIGGLIALAEAFDGFKNLGLSVAIVINKAFLSIIDTILKIPTALGVLIPALGVIKLAASSIRDNIAGSIENLEASLNNNILAQQAKEGGKKTGEDFNDGFNEGISGIDERTKKILDAADEELARERAEKAKSLPKPFEGSFNIPLDAAQDFAQVEGTLTPLAGKFSEIKEEVIQLTQVGQIFTNSFTTGFSNILSGTESVSEGFRNMGKNLLNALTNAALNAAFTNLFKNLGGIFATTGGAKDGGPIGTFAEGGSVSGPGGPRTDSIPAWLSNGEYVINAKSAGMLGLSLLNKLNSLGKGFNPKSRLGLPAFADGGAVSGSSGVAVNVINNSSQPVNARASTRFDGRQLIIDTFLEDARSNGPMSQNIQNMYGVRR